MRICIDIDGTICPIRKESQSYQDLKPLKGAVEKIKLLKKQGAYIILFTARHMKTCDSNVGKVIARQGQILINWLSKYKVEYDELLFGKPYAHVYIDDRAYQFKGWDTIDENSFREYL